MDYTITFDVGGTTFRTRVGTLAKSSALSSWCATRYSTTTPIFIDGDPATFSLMLNFLRTGRAFVDGMPRHQMLGLLLDAETYGVPDLASILKRALGLAPGFILKESDLGTWGGEARSGPAEGVVREGLLLDLDARNSRGELLQGTTWADTSGRGNNGALRGRSHFVDECGGAVRVGELGDGDRVVIPVDINPDVMPQVTLEIWIKLFSIPNNRGWAFGHDDGGYDRTIIMHDERFGHVPSVALAVGETYDFNGGKPALMRWMHVVGVWRQHGASELYIDGYLSGSHPNTVNLSGHRQLTLGNWPNDIAHQVDALIAIARVYNRALNPAEIRTNYHAVESRFKHA
ncbi:hypothetical protein Pelo_536 [Pelomyxa schiedti]|nr:hypothetical protein Pelo_536 [Pelomyxa schiedti]